MDYRKYQNARDASWQILIDQNIKELPVPIVSICRSLGITVKYNNDLVNSENSGNSTMIDGKAYIMLDPKCEQHRKRFTIAHELGHLLLGHVGKYELINREPSPNDNPIEQEANVFASRLLAPACVLWGCKVKSAAEISELCNISLVSAEYRFERYRVLLMRNRFLTSPLERKVYKQFEEFILNHQHQASD